ncbi:hypothetical protein [Zunongwangia sp.]|uniref:hypothetical protein n=1 Tax=Zunongwangia sp. TaxID=1965325 RepID=UPI003AA8174A
MALEKEMTLYNLEKKLFYSCFFILGKNENLLSKDNHISTPLLLFPASIETLDEDKFLKIEHKNFEINKSALSLLQLKEGLIDKDEFLYLLSERISNQNFIGLKNITCGYPVAGSLLDILVTHQGKNYFIDLIGYPGKYREVLV